MGHVPGPQYSDHCSRRSFPTFKARIQSWRFLTGGENQKRMTQRIQPVPVGISVGNGESGSAEVKMYVCKRLAAAQQPVLLPAAPLRQLSKAIECRGGTVLLRTLLPGRYGGQKYSGGAKSKARSARDEELLKLAATLCGGRMGCTCLCTVTIARKSTGMWC